MASRASSTPGPTPRRRRWRAALGVGGSFLGLAAILVWLAASGRIPGPTALLLLGTLTGIYVGVGVLVAVYRLVQHLE